MRNIQQSFNIYNIPAGENFFLKLSEGILEYFKPTHKLKDIIILVPTKYACEGLKKHFFKRSRELPKIYPINDLSELINKKSINTPLDQIDLIAQISQIILQMNINNFSNITAVSELSKYFANFLHNAALYKIDLEQIMQDINEDLSLHQQKLLLILKDFIKIWQKNPYLIKAEYNNILMNDLHNNLKEKTLIIAGISNNIPSINQLMTRENTFTILYGLDQSLNSQDWNNIEITHPQYNFKQILSNINTPPNKVEIWGSTKYEKKPSFISQALKPAKSCDNWFLTDELNINNINYLECNDQHHEAKSIIKALQNRSYKNAIIITNDDSLMVKIMLHLKMSKIEANIIRDHPIIKSESAIWLQLCLNFALENFSLLSALALFKHPFSTIEEETLTEIELIIRDKNFYSNNIFSIDLENNLFIELLDKTKNFKELLLCSRVNLKELIEAHIDFAQSISKPSIWINTSGVELKIYLDQLKSNALLLGEIPPEDYQNLFNYFLKSSYYREEYQSHPITLLKPIDGRLHTADLVILAGLNEEIWPSKPTIDPCINKNLLNKIGLPCSEASIGEEAYDFQCFAENPEIILTRSKKIEGLLTSPSRWLLRILTLAKNLNNSSKKENLEIDYTNKDISPPAPDLKYRPIKLSVTQIEKLIFNPYHIYVDTILGLRKLPPLTKELSPMDFGNFIHKSIEIYYKNQKLLYEGFIDAGIQALKELNLHHPQIKLIYWPRFTRIAQYFVNDQRLSKKTYLENYGKTNIGKNFTLTARADRIELTENNLVNIIDYKTGRLTTNNAIYNGQSIQLLLEALVILNAGFNFQKHPYKINSLSYIQLSGGENPIDKLEIDINSSDIIDKTKTYVYDLINQYQIKDTPYYYTNKKTLGYCEYSHLARIF